MTTYYLIKDVGARQVLVAQGTNKHVATVLSRMCERRGKIKAFRLTTYLSPMVLEDYAQLAAILAWRKEI